MANVFKPKRSSTASSVPTTSNLADGELAVNSSDKKIYLRDGSNIIEVANASSGGSGIATALTHNGSIKVETTNTGIDVTGHTETDTLNVSGVSTFQNNIIASSTLTVGDTTNITGGAPTDEGVLAVYGTGKNALIIQTSNNNTSRGIAFRNKADSYVGYISIEDVGSNLGDMVFGVSDATETNIGNVEERVRFTKDGDVGIGTDSPGAKLDVRGDLIVSNNARVSGILTVGSSSITLNGTDNSIHGYDALIAPPKRDSIVTITVTVATKTSAHRYYDTGSTSGYFLNGVESPFLTLIPGRTYKFDQSDSSNAGHPLRLYRDVDKNTQYSTNVTTVGTPGSSGAYTQIITGDTTPTVLHYQCSAHVKMGNSLQTNSEGSSTDASSGTYGDARYSPQITVDASGRITGITEVEIFSSGLGADLDLNSNDITGTGNINITGAITASGNINANGDIVGDSSTNISGISSVTATSFHGSASDMTGLTAVGGGTYGSSSAVPVITVDSNGRIASISPVTVSGGGGGGAGSAGVTRNITTFTATAGQTTFNVSYTVGTIDVFLNGSRLTDVEFTATNGTSVVLATGASLNDVIDVAAYSSALGIEVKNNGTLVGTATTINFSTDLNATFSNGTATVVSTASGGGGGGGVSEALAIAYAVAL